LAEDDDEKLGEMLNERLNIMNELKDGAMDDIDAIIAQARFLILNLRFKDGSSLKEVLDQEKLRAELEAEKEIDDDLDEDNDEDE
jgi:hypothetical protein